MPQPTLQDVHVNRPLTNISVAYLQEAAGVESSRTRLSGGPGRKQKRPVLHLRAADFNRDEMQKRALSADPPGRVTT